jgi:hypothetical protein
MRARLLLQSHPRKRPSSLRAALPWLAWACCAVGAVIACAPSSFDNITGAPPIDTDGGDGATPTPVGDPQLPAPRPIGPLSGTWVNTTTPLFRWELKAGTGAILELCNTRACDGEKHTFTAENATELTLPADKALEPGIWFWHLATRAPFTFSTQTSPSWELLVRPKAASATDNNGPGGTIVDINGDGRPDLLLAQESFFGKELTVLFGTPDPTSFQPFLAENTLASFSVQALDVKLGAGDLNGDGFSDVVLPLGADAGHSLYLVPGKENGIDIDGVSALATPRLTESPTLHEAGDTDGDGYGDILVGTKTSVFAVYGTSKGPGPLKYFFFIGPPPLDAGAFEGGAPAQPAPKAPLAVHGGFARNTDVFSDIVMAEPFGQAPVFYLLGGLKREYGAVFFDVEDTQLPSRALAIAAGDFDGDGLTDTAFSTENGGKLDICVVSGATELPRKADVHCWPAPSPMPAGFASSLAAADVDADGRDEVLVGSTSGGIWILRQESSALVPKHIDTPFGRSLTVIHPGRPALPIWAATRSDGTPEVAIFRGEALANKLIGADFGAKTMGPAIR